MTSAELKQQEKLKRAEVALARAELAEAEHAATAFSAQFGSAENVSAYMKLQEEARGLDAQREILTAKLDRLAGEAADLHAASFRAHADELTEGELKQATTEKQTAEKARLEADDKLATAIWRFNAVQSQYLGAVIDAKVFHNRDRAQYIAKLLAGDDTPLANPYLQQVRNL